MLSALGIQGDNYASARPIRAFQAFEKRPVHAAIAKRGAAYNNFLRAPASDFRGASHRANSAAHTDAHVTFARLHAQLPDQLWHWLPFLIAASRSIT